VREPLGELDGDWARGDRGLDVDRRPVEHQRGAL
jgi:hypothetical protein